MGLQDIVRNAVKIADSVTRDLHEDVTVYRWRGQNDTGGPTYAQALRVKALVEHSGKRIKNEVGEEVLSTTQVTFLTPLPPLSPRVTGREEPIDKRDKIVCANGQTGPILRTDGGLADPSTFNGYVTQVWLG